MDNNETPIASIYPQTLYEYAKNFLDLDDNTPYDLNAWYELAKDRLENYSGNPKMVDVWTQTTYDNITVDVDDEDEDVRKDVCTQTTYDNIIVDDEDVLNAQLGNMDI